MLILLVVVGGVALMAAPYYRKGRRKGEGVQIDLLIQTAKSVCAVEPKKFIPVEGADHNDLIGVLGLEEYRKLLLESGIR